MTNTIYLTTTIPYVNARPHIGFALELVQGDALARYHRLRGDSVRFQTGTDDNALSNVVSARAAGQPVADFVDANSRAFRALAEALDVSADHFIRTSCPRHHDAVRRFLSALRPDDTYEAPYQGLYCPRCEDFYPEKNVPEGTCPEHGAELDRVEETNHFFRLSRYQEALHRLIESRRIEVVPRTREAEVLRFIDRGLRDFSISRGARRSGGWGVDYPGDPSQVVYVWVDALINYLSGLGYPNGENLEAFWGEGSRRIHIVGKNVWKFHAVYWPALLLSAGLPVPDRIFVHGFLTEEGRKISKSSGKASDPVGFVRAYGTDVVRYFLLAHTRPYEDTDFSSERLADAYRADLANSLGNLVSRLTTLCEKAGVQGLDRHIPPVPAGYPEHVETLRFDRAAALLFREIDLLNAELSEERPWETLKSGVNDRLCRRLRTWSERLHAVAYWLGPFLPASSSRVIDALTGSPIRKREPLFPRLA